MYTSSIIKGENLFASGNQVVFTGEELKGKELIESETIENPYEKNKTCNINLTITKATDTEPTKIEACVTCDNKGQKVITCAKKDEVVVTCKNSRGEVVTCN